MELDNYAFTKSHTQIAKGVAIILMMIHHLFRFPDRLHNVSYISILPFYNPTIEFMIGCFGRICIGMYLFLSGYGLYITYLTKKKFTFKDSFNKILNILINYWVVFAIFVPIRLFFLINENGQVFSIKEFVCNFFVLSNSYNYEWWFIQLYIELVLLFPLMKHIVRENVAVSIGISIFLCIVFVVIPKIIGFLGYVNFMKNSFIYVQLKHVFLYQIIFCVGCITAKFNIFKKINYYLRSKKLNNNSFYLLGIIFIILIRTIIELVISYAGIGDDTYFDFILVPIFIMLCTNAIYDTKNKKVFFVFGKHSTNIWLTHTFFAYYCFQKIVFLPRLSILILIWLSILTISISIIINYAIASINRLTRYIKLIFNGNVSISN